MGQNSKNSEATIPSPVVFRGWLGRALVDVGVSPARLARELGLGKNTVGQFLKHEDRGIDLTNAKKIHVWIMDYAAATGTELLSLNVPHE